MKLMRDIFSMVDPNTFGYWHNISLGITQEMYEDIQANHIKEDYIKYLGQRVHQLINENTRHDPPIGFTYTAPQLAPELIEDSYDRAMKILK